MRKVMTVLLVIAALSAMSATVALADGKPIVPGISVMSVPAGRSLR